MPHDYPAPVHRTGRPSFAIGKLRAESDVRRICKRCDATRRKTIGKTGSRRTEVANFKPEGGIYSGKQKKQQDDERRRLSKEFASHTYRRPERPGGRSAVKLNQRDKQQHDCGQKT